ncbi:hypothetical protein Tco_1563995 [Tanacetum coccineum]
MSSDSASFEVTYTSISSHEDPLAWVVDFFGRQEPNSPEAAPASPDYVPGLEEPEQAPPSPDYVPCPEYPEYLAPADDEIIVEDQPYADYALPIALSLEYVADSDPEEDPEEDPEDSPVDYLTDGGDDDDDDDSSDDDEEEEEEEHLAPADSVIAPTVDFVPSSEETEPFETDEPMPSLSEAEVERLLSLPTPPPSPLISLSPPSAEEHLSRCLVAPTLPSSPLPMVPHPYDSPNHVRAPLGFRATMGRLRASSPSTHHPSPPLPPLPSLLYLPPPVPTSSPLPSPPLPALLSIPPPINHREDIPEVELPPRKRLCLTALTSGYEVGEILTAARPTGGHRADYGFISTLVAETRRQKAEDVGYGIRDVWVDPTEDIYAVIEDAQNRHAQLSQRVDNNMPPKRSFAAAAAATPMTSATVEKLIKARVSAVLANQETLRNSTNGHGDGSHNPDTRIKGIVRTPRECTYKDFLNCKPLTFKGTKGVVVLSQWFEKIESVFHISNCAVENQVKFATCTFLGNALTWWNSYMKTITQDVAYAMD